MQALQLNRRLPLKDSRLNTKKIKKMGAMPPFSHTGTV